MSTASVKFLDVRLPEQRRASRKLSTNYENVQNIQEGYGSEGRRQSRKTSILPRIPSMASRSSASRSSFGGRSRRVSATVVPASLGMQLGNPMGGEVVGSQLVHVPFEYTQVTEDMPDESLGNKPPIGRRRLALPDITDMKNITEHSLSEVDEQDERVKKSLTFKALALKVKVNLKWTQDHKDKKENTSDVKESETDTPTFDVNYYRSNFQSYGGMPKRVRTILAKHPINRTNDELGILQSMVGRLKCFSRYSRKARHELARIINYETFEDGRVVIQQGHIGMSFYFIVSGKVVAKITETDKSSGRTNTQILGELTEGASFGELALLHNIKRTATVVCSGTCEFLRVDKPDFENVLKRVYQQEWNDRYDAISWLRYFNDFNPAELQQFTNLSKSVEFAPGKMILGNIERRELTDNIYFILSGECQVVRVVNLLVDTKAFGGQNTHVPTENEGHLFQPRKLMQRRFTQACLQDRRLWCICTLSRGQYFGVGENLSNTYIMSKSRVECLLVQRVQFTKKGRSDILDEMRDAMNAAYPSEVETVNRYNVSLKWADFKDSIIDEILERPTHRQHLRTSSLADVPLICLQTEHGNRSDVVY